jgi:hypothetical protein
MSIEKVIYTARAKAMGGRVGNQMLGQSCMESILNGLDGGIRKNELNHTQSVLMKICVALIRRGSYGGRYAGNSF